MVEHWFVKCKSCGTPLASRDTSFVPDSDQPEWRSPQWKSDIKCPKCHKSISANNYARHLKRCGTTHKHQAGVLDHPENFFMKI